MQSNTDTSSLTEASLLYNQDFGFPPRLLAARPPLGYTMSSTQPIPSRPHTKALITSSPAPNSAINTPDLQTPNSTPPSAISSSFFESRLAQLLANCEAGTHSFPRDEMDWSDHMKMQQQQELRKAGGRKLSFAGGEGEYILQYVVTSGIVL